MFYKLKLDKFRDNFNMKIYHILKKKFKIHNDEILLSRLLHKKFDSHLIEQLCFSIPVFVAFELADADTTRHTSRAKFLPPVCRKRRKLTSRIKLE